MATFKTKQFVQLSFVIRDFSQSEFTNIEQLNAFVNNLVIEFANDNHLFNERMFRNGCGELISQDCIIHKTGATTNNVKQTLYNGRFI